MPTQIRKTRQKDAIRAAFEEANRPLSTDEALVLAQKHVEGISVATVYRNISTLLEDGWLTAVEMPGGVTRYELSGKEHHHHFQCTQCAKVYELTGCAVQVKPKLPRGFRATGHEFYVYGICADCSI
jgi:Fur family transcriptional regulator, ferric uptake regulator